MASKSATSKRRCTGKDVSARGGVSLPVLATEHGPEGAIRKSRSGRRRAIVLAVVQIGLAVHIVLWLLSRKYGWFDGYTTTPIEPSESMDFVKYGVVNAGLIFFVVALLATLVLGRWFCGWGCHVVLLQDLCGWMMKKAGIRPKPFRSRLLVYVPLLMALYMFVWPAVYRWGWLPMDGWLLETYGAEHWLVASERWFAWVAGFQVGGHPPPWKAELHLTTQDFWRTFAPWFVAIPFLFVCSFGAVYFLGAKGFCTYGCPYGGFFAPVDRVAPMRIRVTDACEQCGHCTAVCTSNVRVHEEVREYGMVVDPGCMKCLDCVSVCPNDALYAGFGRPAVAKGPPKTAKPQRRYDLSWPEEIAFSAVFAISFVSFRGIYQVVPFLMAAGIAGCVTYIAWKGWRLVRDANVSLHRFKLKQKGALQPAGRIYAALAALVVLLTVHCGLVRGSYAMGERHWRRVTFPVGAILEGRPTPPEMVERAGTALGQLRFASTIGAGGVGLLGTWQPQIDNYMTYLHLVRHEFDDAERLARRVMDRDGESPQGWENLFQILLAAQRPDDALAACAGWLEGWPDDLRALRYQAGMLLQMRRLDEAATTLERILAIVPGDPMATSALAEIRRFLNETATSPRRP